MNDLTLKDFITHKVNHQESMNDYSVATDSIRVWIEDFEGERKGFPEYAYLADESGNNRSAVRWISTDKGIAHYYRDGGDWECRAKFKSTDLVASDPGDPNSKYIHILIECTEDEWRKSNGQYAITNKEESTLDTSDDDDLPF